MRQAARYTLFLDGEKHADMQSSEYEISNANVEALRTKQRVTTVRQSLGTYSGTVSVFLTAPKIVPEANHTEINNCIFPQI